MSDCDDLFISEDFGETDERDIQPRPVLTTYVIRPTITTYDIVNATHPVGQWREYMNHRSSDPLGRPNPIQRFPILRVSETEFDYDRASRTNRWGVGSKWEFTITFNMNGMWLNAKKNGQYWESENLYPALPLP